MEMSIAFPDESSLVHRVLDRYGFLDGAADTDDWYESARRQYVFPPVYRCRRVRGASMGERARRAWREHRLRLAVHREEVVRVVRALSPEVPLVILKGTPLAVQIYGDPAARQTSDVDVLVPPSAVRPALARLDDMGFAAPDPDGLRPAATNQVEFEHPDRGTVLDLHWRIAFPHLPVPATSSLVRTSSSVELNGESIPVPGWDGLWLNLAYHFHQHGGFLKGLLDAAAWMETCSGDSRPGRLRRTVGEIGISRISQWPVETLEVVTGADLERVGRSDLRVRSAAARTARAIGRRADEPGARSLTDAPEFLSGVRYFLGRIARASMLDDAGDAVRAMLALALFGSHRGGRFASAVSEGGEENELEVGQVDGPLAGSRVEGILCGESAEFD